MARRSGRLETLLLEFSDVRGRQLAARRLRRQLTLAKPFAHALGLRRPREVRTEVTDWLQRAPAMRTAAALPLSAMLTRDEINTHRRRATRAHGPHRANLGHDAEQLFRRR